MFKSRKRILAFVLTLAMVFSMIPGFSIAVSANPSVRIIFDIDFNPPAGTPRTTEMNSAVGLHIPQPADPVRPDFIFDGWSTLRAGTTRWNFATQTIPGNTNILTLYARWRQNQQTVTFNVNPPAGVTLAANHETLTGTATYRGNGAVPMLGTTTLAALTVGNAATFTNGNGVVSAAWMPIENFNTTTPQITAANNAIPYVADNPVRDVWLRLNRRVDFVHGGTVTNGVLAGPTVTQQTHFIGQLGSLYTVPAIAQRWEITTVANGISYRRQQQPTGYWYTADGVRFLPIGGVEGLTFVNGIARVYAGYHPLPPVTETFTVTLNYNNGDAANQGIEIIVPAGAQLTLPSVSLTGATFFRWESAPNVAFASNNTLVDSDMTLNAIWNRTVTFDPTGGTWGGSTANRTSIIRSDAATQYHNNLPAAVATVDPTRVGLEFRGWFDARFGGNLIIPPRTDDNAEPLILPVTVNRTLFAQWIGGGPGQVLRIDFDTLTSEIGVVSIHVRENASFECPAPTRTGYVLTGWVDEDGAEWPFSAGTSALPATRSMTLTAVWTPTFHVIFRALDGVTHWDIQDILEGDRMTLPVLAPDHGINSARFTGWEVGGELWDFDTPLTVGNIPTTGTQRIVDMRARFERLPIITLDFNNGSGHRISRPVTVRGDNFYFDFPENIHPFRIPSMPGFYFMGWNTMPDGSGATIDTRAAIVTDTDLTFYAMWRPAGITVTFDPNRTGFDSQTRQATSGSRVVPPFFPADGDYVIVSWHTERAGTDANRFDFNSDVIVENTTLFAMWGGGAGKQVTVTFIDGFGSDLGPSAIRSVPWGTTLGRNDAPSLDQFNHLYIFQNEWLFDGNIWDFDTPFTFDITLVASVKHRVQFNTTVPGLSVPDVLAFPGDGLFEPSTPVRTGYVLVDWYLNRERVYDEYNNFSHYDYSDRWRFMARNSVADTVDGNMMLYARWVPIGDFRLPQRGIDYSNPPMRASGNFFTFAQAMQGPGANANNPLRPANAARNRDISLDFDAETIVVADGSRYVIEAISIDGGRTWTAGRPGEANFDRLLANLFNRGGTLWLAVGTVDGGNHRRGFNVNSRRPLGSREGGGENVVAFETVNRRPRVERLTVNYLLDADMTGVTTGWWMLTTPARRNETAQIRRSGIQVGVFDTVTRSVDANGFGQFYQRNIDGGIAVREYGLQDARGRNIRRYTYIYRNAPQMEADGTFTPASRPRRISVLAALRPPRYRINERAARGDNPATATLRLRRGDIIFGGTAENLDELRLSPASLELRAANLTAGNPLIIRESRAEISVTEYYGTILIWNSATARRPASARQILTRERELPEGDVQDVSDVSTGYSTLD